MNTVLICDSRHVDSHNTCASIFSAYTTSLLQIISETNWQYG